MSANVKVRIEEKSALPVVAAILSFMAVLFTLIDKYRILLYYQLSFSLVSVIFPILSFILFSVFALTVTKKNVKLMLIPIVLICLLQLINESGIYYITIMSFRDYVEMMSYLNAFDLILILAECLLALIIILLGVLTFLGVVKSKIVFILICVVNIFVSIALQIMLFIEGEWMIPWNTFTTIVFLVSFMLLAQGLQYGEAKYNNRGMINPPFPNPVPYPYQNLNQNPVNPQMQYQQMQSQQMQSQPPYSPQEFQQKPLYGYNQNLQQGMQSGILPGVQPGMQPDPEFLRSEQEADQQNTNHISQQTVQPVSQPYIQQNTQQIPRMENGVFDTIKQLYELNQKGIISDEEFETKKKELLSKI